MISYQEPIDYLPYMDNQVKLFLERILAFPDLWIFVDKLIVDYVS
jgi:hypothetical protein